MVEDKSTTTSPTDDSGKPDDKGTSDTVDLEKFDPESIKDLDEDSQKKVKGFHADYTKKTQKLAEREKEYKERIAQLEEKAKAGEKWDNWFAENDSLVQEFNSWKAKKDQGEPDDDDNDNPDDDYSDPSVKKLKKTVAQTQKEMNELSKATKTSNKMLMDLVFEMQSKRYRELSFDINPYDVLTYARENNVMDMKRAIEGCYSQRIKEDEFQKRLEEEKEKWEEQQKTKVVTAMPRGRQVRNVIARKRGSTE